jgi:hypothetical protein
MNVMTIRGKLIPSDVEAAACAFVRVRLYWSFTQNGLRELVTYGTAWDETGISFNNVTFFAGTDKDVEKFVNNLNEVMKTEDAVRLGLNGIFNVEVETLDSILTYSVKVTEGKVTYEEVAQGQDNKVTA